MWSDLGLEEPGLDVKDKERSPEKMHPSVEEGELTLSLLEEVGGSAADVEITCKRFGKD